MPFIVRKGIPQCNKPGVYSITNTVNGKVYVGSALSIKGRLLYHRSFLRRGKHDNSYLQRAWFKYGEEAFRFDVLETCEAGECVKLEQYWIDSLGVTCRANGYNICPVAGSAMAGRKHSDESRAKMSADRKGIKPVAEAGILAAKATRGIPRSEEVRAKISAGHKGKKKSPEHLAKLKEAHWSKGPNAVEIAAKSAAKNRGRKHSIEWRRKIAAGNRRRWAKQRHHRLSDPLPVCSRLSARG